MTISNPAFVNAIAERGILNEEEMQDVLWPLGDASRLLHYLLNQQILPRREIGQLWADGFGVANIDLDTTLFQQELIPRLPREFAEKNRMILVYQLGEAVTAAMANPTDRNAIAAAAAIIGVPISPVCALPDQIDHAIELQYHSFAELAELKKAARLTRAINVASGPLTKAELERLAGQEVSIKLVHTIMLLALKERASDIHIEPFETFIMVRFRIDGTLIERTRLSPDLYPRLLSRIKVTSGMDISERRRPQDGRLSMEVGSRKIDFRVSAVPAIYGEKIVLRALGQLKSYDTPTLDELDLSHVIFEQMRKVISKPNGIFFITGPTGSGKTTTLFSALKYINQPGVNIMTVEDPVEYRLPGITQVQVNRPTGVGFPEVLRAFLRQDPDVMLIGEIRDPETAKIASEAALTGHLVLTTLHTNDAVQAVTRLIEIGIEPFMVGASVIAVMGQRLVRRICPLCKHDYDPGDEVMNRLFEWDGKTRVPFYRGAGCNSCNNTGFHGRIAIHEMLIIDDDMRRLISEKAPTHDLYQAAYRSGYQGLRYDGIKKVLRGLTTLEEVEHAAPWQ